MAFERYCVRARGRVPSDIASLFSSSSSASSHTESNSSVEPPKKRIKLSKHASRLDLQHAADILPRYLAIGKFEISLEFAACSSHPTTTDTDAVDVPVIVSVMYSDSLRADVNITLRTNDWEIVLRGVEGLDISGDGMVGALKPALSSSTSIYRRREKLPTILSQTYLRKAFSHDHQVYILDTRILWLDSTNIYHTLPPFGLNALWKYYKAQVGSHADSVNAKNQLNKFSPLETHQQLGLSDFYESVHVPSAQLHVPAMQPQKSVKSELYPFQRRAVHWLLKREGIDVAPDGSLRPLLQEDKLPLSFFETKDLDGRLCYVSLLFHTVSTDLSAWYHAEKSLRGGILAEEMGLGKTVEMLSLICAHPRPDQINGYPSTPDGLLPSRATLIITPPSILKQWEQEVATHAPMLRVKNYTGLKKSSEDDLELARDLASYDIVLMTYMVLNTEIYYAEDPPDRPIRRGKKIPKRRKSPLMQIHWWRVCIDEAQMVESQTSKPSRVARIIPRCNAWAMTGTPLQKSIEDLYGLLVFLHYEPYSLSSSIWKNVCTFPPVFKTLVGNIVLRHNKETVSNEIRLPKQKRVVITIPFTPVEEKQYDGLFQLMCNDCGLDRAGVPTNAQSDQSPLEMHPKIVFAKMRSWFLKLRQTCIDPESGLLGSRSNDKPVKPVNEVLTAMIDQNEVQIRTNERILLQLQLRRGQIVENGEMPKRALEIWQDAAERSGVIVKDCRDQLEEELARNSDQGVPNTGNKGEDEHNHDINEAAELDSEHVSRLGVLRHRLRNALEIEHMCQFFIANAYFQIKTDSNLTQEESDDYRRLQMLEEAGYEKAKNIRKEMLAEAHQSVNRQINRLHSMIDKDDIIHVPKITLNMKFLKENDHPIIAKMVDLCDVMKLHINTLNEWVDHLAKLLVRALVDEEESTDVTGDEYESSTKHQDEMFAYMEGLRFMFARHFMAVTGQVNHLIERDMKIAQYRAENGEGSAPELVLSLIQKCNSFKLPAGHLSLRGVVDKLRNFRGDLGDKHTERILVKDVLREASENFSAQSTAIPLLERQLGFFTSITNRRLQYYRQLQQISDTVAPYDGLTRGQFDKSLYDAQISKEEDLKPKLAILKSTHRYLIHLRDESGADETSRICVICNSTIERGVLTVCGHKYCEDCIKRWRRQSHRCPTCKTFLKSIDLHNITYKPQEIVAQEESAPVTEKGATAKNPIYSNISPTLLSQIQSVNLPRSFGTKIDTLSRHLIWLRQHDPGAKSIVFSQSKRFLRLLGQVFNNFNIGYSSIDHPSGVETFKDDPTKECFLLHAKAHASGLNLVVATHILLCEPLINTAIELQAIARVHRIGQRQKTTVWMYLVANTVEESIYQLSVSRRLAHIAQKHRELSGKTSKQFETSSHLLDNHDIAKSQQLVQGTEYEDCSTTRNQVNLLQDVDDSVLESANSHELEEAPLGRLTLGPDGERVADSDMWQCLFGNQKRNDTGARETVDEEAIEQITN